MSKEKTGFVNEVNEMKTVTQWVVETSAKKTHWGWTSFYKTEQEARRSYDARLKDKHFASVRIYKETFNKKVA